MPYVQTTAPNHNEHVLLRFLASWRSALLELGYHDAPGMTLEKAAWIVSEIDKDRKAEASAERVALMNEAQTELRRLLSGG